MHRLHLVADWQLGELRGYLLLDNEQLLWVVNDNKAGMAVQLHGDADHGESRARERGSRRTFFRWRWGNTDAHLKNFGRRYADALDVRLAPCSTGS